MCHLLTCITRFVCECLSHTRNGVVPGFDGYSLSMVSWFTALIFSLICNNKSLFFIQSQTQTHTHTRGIPWLRLVLVSSLNLTFMWPCIVNVFFQVYQQDATLYNILYYCQCSTCFRRFLRPSSGAQNSTQNIGYMWSLFAATAITLHLVGILERIH